MREKSTNIKEKERNERVTDKTKEKTKDKSNADKSSMYIPIK